MSEEEKQQEQTAEAVENTEQQEVEATETAEEQVETQETQETQDTEETQETEEAQTGEKSEREELRDMLKKVFPDFEVGEDEDEETKLVANVNELVEYQKKNKEANQAVMEALEASPVISKILSEIMQGSDEIEAFARNIDLDDIKPVEGEPDMEKWNQAKEDRKKRLEAETKMREEWNANMTQTTNNLSEFVKEKGFNEDQSNDFAQKVDNVLTNILNGKMDKAFLEAMYKSFNYDQDIKKAQEAGEVKGRNEQIEVKKEKKSEGDGLPDIKKQSAEKKEKTKENPKVEALRELAQRMKQKQVL